MGKRKGNQRDSLFSLFGDAEFKAKFYDRRKGFDAAFRLRGTRSQGPGHPQRPEARAMIQPGPEEPDRSRLMLDA